MSSKVQAFQDVSAAIDLDSNGHHEIAFTKYLQCLLSLSSFLVEQVGVNGYSAMDDVQKKEAKQVLSVICESANRANFILKFEGEANVSEVSTEASAPPLDGKASSLHIFDDRISTSESSVTDSYVPYRDPNPASQVPSHKFRSPAFVKMEKDNASLIKKFQFRMEYVKDRHIRQNLGLELQRGIAENLMIARAKQAQILKQQQEERKSALEMRIQNMLLTGPCTNPKEQEKRALYVEVLRHEAKQSSDCPGMDYISPGLSASEVAEIIFQQTLKCSTHPLTQWLIIEQVKLQKQLLHMLKEFSHYIPLLPEPVLEHSHQRNIIVYPGHKDVRLWELQKYLDDLTQVIRDVIDSAVEILYTVYKERLSEEAETLAYRLTESLLILPLWPLIIVLVRITNLESELRVAQTMMDCHVHIREFAASCGVSDAQFELCSHNVCELKKMPSLLSLCDKLSVLVHVCQSVCESGMARVDSSGTQERRLGADDLVPVLSYICALSGIPHMMSECRTLDLLIHPRYMLGEEGYSLTSFQTALNYLEMKKYISPFVHGAKHNGTEGISADDRMSATPEES